MPEKFEIIAMGMILVLKYYLDPYYEGEDRVEHSMLIHENDIDDLLDVLDQYIEKRGGETEIKETVRGLATGLITGFAWEDTKDGRDYWQDVYKRLLRIAKEGF